MSDQAQLADEFLLESALNSDPVVSISKDKRVIHCVDNNNGSYQSGVTTIDATSQLNGSTGYGSLRDGYLTVPYVVTAKNTGGSSLGGVMNRFCVGMKTGVWNVIDSLSVELNGKSISTEDNYKCYWNNLRAMTEWSDDEIIKHGADSFCLLYPDEVNSITYPMASQLPDNSTRGDGFCNNTTGYAAIATGTAVAAGTVYSTAAFQIAGLIKELDPAGSLNVFK